RHHGLSIDHLRAVEIVTGAGRAVRASATSNADLFWAARGAGSFIGIVTSYEFDLIPVGPVVAGMVLHPFDRAREVLEFFCDFTAQAPEELTTMTGMLHGPDGRKMVGVGVTWSGDLETGEKVIAPLRNFGPPVMDMIGTMPYGLLQRELAKMSPPGLNRSMKSAYFDRANDDFIATAIDAFSSAPTRECMVLIEHAGGAANRVPPDETAFPHRDVQYNLIVDAGWQETTSGRDAYFWMASTWNRLRPHVRKSAYLGYLDADDIGRGLEAFGASNFARLRELKREHDPAHVLASLPGLR
ncbi:MAG: FAD-binding oxidoreductase, partial [Thermomicrobiales bacterium]